MLVHTLRIAALGVIGALACTVGYDTTDPQSNCVVTDVGGWVANSLDESSVTSPVCPVIVTGHDQSIFLGMNVIAQDPSKISQSSPIVRLSMFDANVQPIPPDAFHKDLTAPFSGGTAQVLVTYYAAHAASITSGNDMARVRVPLATFTSGNRDTARSQVYLRFRFHSQAGAQGPSWVQPNINIAVFADAGGEFRPITYQWWIDGVSQGGAGAASNLTTSFATIGTHSVRVLVTADDGHTYDLVHYVEVSPCPNGEIIC